MCMLEPWHCTHTHTHTVYQPTHKHKHTYAQLLPFLEYDLHRQLMLKLRVQGRNAVFALRSQLQVCPCAYVYECACMDATA